MHTETNCCQISHRTKREIYNEIEATSQKLVVWVMAFYAILYAACVVSSPALSTTAPSTLLVVSIQPDPTARQSMTSPEAHVKMPIPLQILSLALDSSIDGKEPFDAEKCDFSTDRGKGHAAKLVTEFRSTAY